MSGLSNRTFSMVALVVIVALTLSTAYIHYWVGGMMLMLNALGYVGLVVLLVGSYLFMRQAMPLVMVALALYAVVTILGWLVMGPYFDVAYLAKAIEVALIATIAFTLWRSRDELSASIAWARSMLDRVLGRQPARPAGTAREE